MKKTIFSLLILCVIITSAFSQNGYKSFKWGMTSEQVSKIALVPAIQESEEDDVNPTFQKNTWGEDDGDDSSPYDDGESLALVMYYLYRSEMNHPAASGRGIKTQKTKMFAPRGGELALKRLIKRFNP